MRSLNSLPDAAYGHFLYPGGATAVWVGSQLSIPSFVAVGEGNFWTVRPLGVERAHRDFSAVTGAIAVSKLLRQRLIADLGFPGVKVNVIPNGVNLAQFYPRDRLAMREKYDLPKNIFLVAYVGNFIESKGVGRVRDAIDGIEGVAAIFVGSGPLTPVGSNVVFCGRVKHEQVPELLSAADCFVLPSDVEGSSNATLEALACGLPVIVSDGPFNDDIAGADCSIRVPWHDVAEIRGAIRTIQSEPMRATKMSLAARTHAKRFCLSDRADTVLNWLETCAVGFNRSDHRIPDTSQ